ncbi:MAG: TolC family protein, partial [Mariprofundaceae bacterium]|nr:TolC family protein [Mariprofundaceae bacterium]
TVAEQKEIIEQDRQAIFAGQPPISKKLDLYDAMARALKYNVDYRTKLFEKQVALGQYDLSKYKFLPAFNVGSAINYRSNLPIADSLDTGTNLRVPSFATASDRTIRTADVRMIWNLLDFGVTYYQVKQEGNKALMADEARRKVVSQLLRDVRSAYWRAAIAQMMQPKIERILSEAREALDSSSEAQRKGLASPVKVLEYRKALLKLVDTLENLFNQMEMAKTQLASLINEPLGQDFELDIPAELPMDVANVPFCLPKMEELALLNKPEIREEIYRKRISVAETRKATLRMLPGLQLSSGENYSSNSFLHNKAWTAAGAQVTWNIFNILSGPAAIKVSKANESVDDQR